MAATERSLSRYVGIFLGKLDFMSFINDGKGLGREGSDFNSACPHFFWSQRQLHVHVLGRRIVVCTML